LLCCASLLPPPLLNFGNALLHIAKLVQTSIKQFEVPVIGALCLFMANGILPASDLRVRSMCFDPSIDFVTNPGWGTVRSDLLNSALFGPTGVVNRSIQFLPSSHTITPGNLAGVDLLMIVAFGIPSNSDLTELRSFVEVGGGLFVFGNDMGSYASLVGGSFGQKGGGTSTATIVNSNSPLVSGPFGNLTVGTQFYLPYHSSLSSSGIAGVVGVTDGSGPFAISYQIGQGRVVLIGDEEIFLNADPGFSADPKLTNTTRLLFQNAFAYVATVPEPSTYALGLIAAGAMAWLTRRRKGSQDRA